MQSLSKLWRNASGKLLSRLPEFKYWLSCLWHGQTGPQRRWMKWRWKKHKNPTPLAPHEKFILDEAPLEVVEDYITRTKQWSGSAPMTASVVKAEIRHRRMRDQLAKAPKHITPGTPEFDKLEARLYRIDGYQPPVKYISDRAEV